MEDETGFKVGTIIKNMIFKFLKLFPSIIINENSYKNKNPPNHWKLETSHKRIVSSNIFQEYKGFEEFFGDPDLKKLFKKHYG
jgi:hypothetical protein